MSRLSQTGSNLPWSPAVFAILCLASNLLFAAFTVTEAYTYRFFASPPVQDWKSDPSRRSSISFWNVMGFEQVPAMSLQLFLYGIVPSLIFAAIASRRSFPVRLRPVLWRGVSSALWIVAVVEVYFVILFHRSAPHDLIESPLAEYLALAFFYFLNCVASGAGSAWIAYRYLKILERRDT